MLKKFYQLESKSMSPSRYSSVSIGLGYGLNDRLSILGRGWDVFFSSPRPDRFWSPAKFPVQFLSGSFPEDKAAEAWADH
jgi:hypothetical protein